MDRLKQRGQFGAEKGGQFAPESGGQFSAEKRGQFERKIHFGGTIKAAALRIPQEVNGSNIEDFLTTVDEIEILTGIEFFSELSITKQANLESKKRNLKLEEVNN